MALPFWCSLSPMALPSEAPALPPTQEKTYLPQWSLKQYTEIRLISDLVWPDLAMIRMEISSKIKKSTYFFTCTAGHLNSLFVPAVGHLPVCWDGRCWKWLTLLETVDKLWQFIWSIFAPKTTHCMQRDAEILFVGVGLGSKQKTKWRGNRPQEGYLKLPRSGSWIIVFINFGKNLKRNVLFPSVGKMLYKVMWKFTCYFHAYLYK